MIQDALQLLVQFNGTVYLNIANALEVAGYIVLLGLFIGLPLGILVGLWRFPVRRLVLYLLHVWLFLPATGLGIFLYFLQNGKFITPIGFIVWGSVLVFPIIAAMIANIFVSDSREALENAASLGATRWQLIGTLLKEKREQIYGIMTLAIARVFTEIGGFYLVVSFLYNQGFPSRPIYDLSGAAEHLAVAFGILFFGILVYTGLHFAQFRRER